MTWYQVGLIISGIIVGGFGGALLAHWIRPVKRAVKVPRELFDELDTKINLHRQTLEERLRILERSHLRLKTDHEQARTALKELAKTSGTVSFDELAKRF